MPNCVILEAVDALESLDYTPVGCRNERIRILSKHRGNPVLRLLLQVGTDKLFDPLICTAGLSPKSPNQNTAKQPLEASLEQFQRHVMGADARKRGLGVRRREFAELLHRTDERLSPWLLKAVSKDLGIGVGYGLLHSVFGEDFCPAIQMPWALDSTTKGIRLFFFIRNGSCICLTGDNQREYQIAVDAFGSQLIRTCDDEALVIEAELWANDWEAVEHLLASKTKSLQRRWYQWLFYSLKLKMTRCWRWDDFWTESQREDFALLETIYRDLKERSPRTSVSLVNRLYPGTLQRQPQLAHFGSIQISCDL